MTQAEFNALKRNENGYLVIPDGTDCTEIAFKRIDRIEFGKYCELGDESELGYWCRLGEGCELGDECVLGDYCTLGSECKLGDECELGYGCQLGDRCEIGESCVLGGRCKLGDGCEIGDECNLAYGCRLGDNCVLGDGCTLGFDCDLGDGCKFGDGCDLGDGCKLGRGCELGDRCRLSEYIDARATFEAGRVRDGLYVQIGNIGCEHRTVYFYIDKDGSMFARAGDWFGGLNDLKERVKGVHGGTIYETQYMAACAYAETVLPQMLKESDAARAEEK